MSDIKLSIIMPCYNCESTVKEAVESIYKQHMSFSFEVIMLDDGSTDKTVEILKHLETKHDEIHVFQNEENMGECYSRNRAISLCKGSIIGYLDADNLFDTHCLQNMVSFIENNNVDGAHIEQFKRFSRSIKRYKTWTFENQYLSLPIFLKEEKIFDHFFLKRECFTNDILYFENHGLGNLDASLKVLSSGLKIKIAPNTAIFHRFFSKHKSLFERVYCTGKITFHQLNCFEYIFYLLPENELLSLIQFDFNASQHFSAFFRTKFTTTIEANYTSTSNWKMTLEKLENQDSFRALFLRSINYFHSNDYYNSLLCLLSLIKRGHNSMMIQYFLQRSLAGLMGIKKPLDITSTALENSGVSPTRQSLFLRPSFAQKVKAKLTSWFL